MYYNNNNNNNNNNIYIYPTGVVVSNKNPDGENPSVFWQRWIFFFAAGRSNAGSILGLHFQRAGRLRGFRGTKKRLFSKAKHMAFCHPKWMWVKMEDRCGTTDVNV